jgi:hypothetical protein
MNSVRRLIIYFSFIASSFAHASGTVVKNGGDPLFHFLEATRSSFVETLNTIRSQASERDKFCSLKGLSVEQSVFCRSFLVNVVDQLIGLNTQNGKIKFVLRESPLVVTGPDGKPMSVAARTELGPQGVVEFHRDAIKLMAPTQILFLLAHEFQHKVNYHGKFVTDDEVIGSFASGRDLLDTVARAIVEVAKRRGHIGSQYELRDTFDCQSFDGAGRSGSIVSSPRLFLDESLSSYETSMGRTPLDGGPYVPEYGGARLIFRVKIFESGNCSEESYFTSRRRTDLHIVRTYTLDNQGNSRPEEILHSQTLEGFNPICDKERKPFSLSYGGITFTCNYYGTSGRTSTSF